MIQYLQKRFAFSPEGARDFVFSTLWSTLQNLALMFPAFFTLPFLKGRLIEVTGGDGEQILNIWFYVLIPIVLCLIMYLISVRQYDSCYTKTYEESAKLRIQLAEKLRKLPLAYFGKKDIADLSATIMQDVTELETLFSHTVPQLYASLFSAGLLSILLFIFNYKMTLALLWVVPTAFLVFFFSRKLQKRAQKKLFLEKRAILDRVQEGLDSMAEMKVYSYEQEYISHLHSLLDHYEKTMIQMELVLGTLINFSYTLLKLGLVSVVLVGAHLYARGSIDLFTYIVFMIISTSIYRPFMQCLDNLAALFFLEARIDRMKEMEAMPVQEGSTDFRPSSYDIVFDGVSFSYDEGVQTIKEMSFCAKQGEVTALVGPSGGGKSTVSKLAARFWDVDSGKVTLGGVDLSTVDPETLLQYYSIVFQDVTLFNFSVLENIRIGKKDATDEEVLLAAKLAQCDEFVEKLPMGYHTLIGENGEKLSGGERQRISIARAMLKDAPVILLDEATASLDAENETKIQQALTELIKEKTVLIIAHRMRTVLGADKVLVICDGRLEEMGRPDELLKAGGYFYQMNRKNP